MSSAADSAQPQVQYLTTVLHKSFSLSKQFYAYSGLNNEFLESNAARFSEFSSGVVALVDSRINATTSQIVAVKGALAEKARANTQQLVETASNLSVVQQANKITNQLLTELEAHLVCIQREVSTRFNVEVPAAAEGESKASLSEQNVFTRLNQVASTIQVLSSLLVSKYYDIVNDKVQDKFSVVSVRTKVLRSSLESFAEVLYGTVILQHVVIPLLNQVKVTYASAQEKVVVVVENIKKIEVKALLEQSQGKYNALREATVVAIRGNKVSFAFAKEVFASSADNIQENLSQLLKDVASIRVRFIEAAGELYSLSVQEFQRKKAVKLGEESAPQVEQPADEVSSA